MEFFLEWWICLEGEGESVDEEAADVFFVEIFEFDDESFEEWIVSERDNYAFYNEIFVVFAVETFLVIFGKSVADRADLGVGLEKFFAGFAQICACSSTDYTGSWKDEVDNVKSHKV